MHNRMHNPSFYMHSYSMHNSLIIQRKQTYIPALTMFIISHETVYKLQRWISSSTYLLMKNPATSYVAATFHPTIGQRAHQSLSNAATPELGMIPPRIRVKAGLHIARGHNQPNQHRWVTRPSTIDQASTVRRPTTTYHSNTIPSQHREGGKDNQG